MVDHEKRAKNLGKIERLTVIKAVEYLLKRRVKEEQPGPIEVRNDAIRQDKRHFITIAKAAGCIMRHP